VPLVFLRLNPSLVVRDAEGKVSDGHLADHHAALLAKGVTRDRADLVRTRVNKVLRLTKAEHISHLSPSAVQGAIAAIREKGLSLQTCNDTLRAMKQLSRWLWRDGRAREHTLVHLTGFNVALDRRHDRRALTDDELTRLIAAAEQGRKVLGMTGPDRAMLYRLAIGTGFRANELRSLTPESFDLDADPPTVTVEAGYSKHRRKDVQPIRRDLAEMLRPWFKGKKRGKPVFRMPDKAAKMMPQDLKAGREAWLNEAPSEKDRKEREKVSFLAYRDASGRVADFHALRHTYISRPVRSGANIKVAQELARHSTPTLTLGRYAHVTLMDQRRALDALPTIEKAGEEGEAPAATGTDDAGAVGAGRPAFSALSARRRPGTPKAAVTCHEEESEGESGEGGRKWRTCRHLRPPVNT